MEVPDKPDHARALSIYQHQLAGMFRNPADEHDGSGDGSVEVPDRDGTLHWSVAGFLQLLSGAGHSGRCGTAGHLAI